MTAAEPSAGHQAVRARRVAIADAWYRALARTGYVSVDPAELRRRLTDLTERAGDLLVAEQHGRDARLAIGRELATLYYGHPEALSRTLEVLGNGFIADVAAAHESAPPPAVMALLADLAAGFLGHARDTILAEQETIRGALLAAGQQAAEASRASQARFRAIFDSAAIGMGIGDVSGLILETNPALQAMFGYSADEFRQMVVAQFMHPEDAASVWALYEDLVGGRREHFAAEKRFYRKDGQLVWSHLTVSLVRDAEGQPHYQIAMLENITERKQAEETVRQLNADLERRVLERTAQLTALNQELASEITRRTQAEAERLALLTQEQTARAEAEAAQQRLAFLAEASGVVAASLDYKTTLTNLAHLAVPYLADWCAVDVVDEEMAPQRLAVAHVDLAKQELVRSLQRHYQPAPDALSGVIHVLRTGQPEFLPEIPAALLLAAASDESVRPIVDALHPRSRITVPLRARERILGAISIVLSGPNRRYTPADVVLAEDLARHAAAAIDNAQLYREAQDALAARDEFLSVAAHELKTPITSVRGFVELATRQLAREEGPDPLRLERAVRAVDRESRKLSQLVSQLFDVSRIQVGQFALARAMTDVARLVREAAASAQLTTSQHTIGIEAPHAVWALVDPLRLEQVITNLLSNAIKYSPQGGAIDVAVARPRADLLRIAVRDRGVGIASERRARLFERFYQTRAGDRIAGLGLGLYISRQIVEAHGGQIEVESPPDGGTRVIVDLPIDREGREEGRSA